MDLQQGPGVAAWNQWAQAAGERIARLNVFYLLSACLMLLGCYLISLPYLLAPQREVGELLLLLGVINVYEGLVILACGFIVRHTPASREATWLLFIEFLFLFDMTFTVNACLPRNFVLGVSVAAGSFVLALLKLYCLEAGTQRPLFSGLKRFLVPALLLLYSLQGQLVLYSPELPELRARCAYVLWLAFGALSLLLPPVESEETNGGQPWCVTLSFRRVVAALSLGLLATQLLAQSWVHRVPVEFSFVLPALCALIAAAPFAFTLESAKRYAGERAMLLVGLCAVGLLAGSNHAWATPVRDVTLTPQRMNLFFAAAVAGVMLWRERRHCHAGALCLLVLAGIIGADIAALERFVWQPSAGQFRACVALGAAYVAFRPSAQRGAAALLVNLWLLLRLLDVSALSWEFLRWGLVAVLLVHTAFGVKSRIWWWVLHAAVFACGVASCRPESSVALAYFYAVALLWAVGAARHRRGYGLLLLAYLVASNAGLVANNMPDVSIRWGWLVVATAFVVFGLAFSVTRRNVATRR